MLILYRNMLSWFIFYFLLMQIQVDFQYIYNKIVFKHTRILNIEKLLKRQHLSWVLLNHLKHCFWHFNKFSNIYDLHLPSSTLIVLCYTACITYHCQKFVTSIKPVRNQMHSTEVSVQLNVLITIVCSTCVLLL